MWREKAVYRSGDCGAKAAQETVQNETIHGRRGGSYSGREVYSLLAIAKDWERKREDLKVRRAPLAAKYDKHPGDLQLAVKLMKIDDEIAECTEFMTRERRLNPATGG